MSYSFCTYFDSGYLSRGLALYESLRQHCAAFQLWVLCLDTACYDTLKQLKLANVYPLSLEDFEMGDESLLAAKQNRSLIEYYFTCTPSLFLYILKRQSNVDLLTYLDADLFFFADPALVFGEMSTRSIAIIEHRFPPALRHLEWHGVYNIGWISIRRDEQGLACLSRWRAQCLEWCYDEIAVGRFADQKYLDDWPDRFSNLVVLRHKGANLAPWNLATYNVHGDARGIWVDDQPLIFFHFHGLRRVRDWLYDPSLTIYKAKCTALIKHAIYAPYIQSLREATQRLFVQAPHEKHHRLVFQRGVWWLRFAGMLKRVGRFWIDLFSGQLIVMVNGHVK